MIEIKTFNETKNGFDCRVHFEGKASIVAIELVTVFNKIYEQSPKLFEACLLACKYTEDHT